MTFGERLRTELKSQDVSIRAFHFKLHEQKVRGSSYSSVRSYIDDTAKPPLEFIRAAAEFLNVREAYLESGEPPRTDAEAQVRAIGDASSPYQAIHEEGMITAFATQGVGNNLFFYIVERLVAAAPGEGPAPNRDDFRLLSRGLQAWIQAPWRTMRRGRPASLEASADYHLAMMTALLRAVPRRGQGRTIRDVIKDMGGLLPDGAESGKEN